MVRVRLISRVGGGGGSTDCGNGKGGAGCFVIGGAFSSIGGGGGGACGCARSKIGGAFGSTSSSAIDVSPVIGCVPVIHGLGGALTSTTGGAFLAAARCSGPGGLFAVPNIGGAFGLFAGSSSGGGVFVACCLVIGMKSGGLWISSTSGSAAKKGLDC